MSKYPADPASHAAAVKVAVAAGRAADVDSILEKTAAAFRRPSSRATVWRSTCGMSSIGIRRNRLTVGRRLLTEGIAAADEALELKPDFLAAVVYKSLLLRLQATRTSRMPVARRR